MADEQGERLLDELQKSAPRTLDLTDGSHLDRVRELADELLASASSSEDLCALETRLVESGKDAALGAHVAVKLARSKHLLAALREPHHLSVVFALFKEHERILSKREHPLGEDFLRRKLRQLDWLFEDSPNSSWDLIAVDDGCPEGSGRLAEEIIQSEGRGDQARVLYLQDAIDERHPATEPLRDTADSQKGGSILYGMARAAAKTRANHVIVFTDADLSTHLGQVGLLLDGIYGQGKDAAIGSRREQASVVVKKGARNVRGKLFIYLWKRLLPQLGYITDTQCGFKAFRAPVVRQIVPDMLEKKFAFDIELLLKAELAHAGSIVKVPIAWIDSEAASTTTDMAPYLPMLKSIVAMYRRYLPAAPQPDTFADFVGSLDEKAWERLLASVPAPIAEGDPATFSRFDAISADDLRALLD